MKKMEMFGDALATLGHDIAMKAAEQESQAQESWDKIKTMFSLAKALGAEGEAFDALYGAGERVVQKKAIWYRRQKQIVKMAMEYGVDISTMTQREAAEAVEAAREAAKTPQQKAADALRMVERSVKGAVATGATRNLAAAVAVGTKRGSKATARAH